jgi:hypothetical protein
MKSLKTSFIFFISIVLLSCNKDDNNNNSQISCSTDEGNFSINVNGSNHDMVVNSETQFSILFNWYGNNESAFILDSKDQNGNPMYLELSLPGEFNNGSTTYSSSTLNFDFFTIDVDTFNLYVSEVTFDVTESNLNQQDGIYRPVNGTFTGTAHSFPWTNGQPPINTLDINGSFCLNGIIMP